jgi:ribosomal protein S18 acetylase RimI-like enzyme
MAPVVKLSVVHAHGAGRLSQVRGLFEEYAASLGVDLCFQGFEEELAGLPGSYSPPSGRLLLAVQDDEAAGCVALRRMEQDVCEMKRLYVRPAFQGLGIGRMLVERVIEEARDAGYRRMRLDTLPTMISARALYRRIGFHEIAPYRSNPVEGVTFLELDLKPSDHDA